MGQAALCCAAPRPPPPVVADVEGSWPYVTVSQRMVSILRSVVDTVSRDAPALTEEAQPGGQEGVQQALRQLEQLLQSLTADGPLTPLTGSADDVTMWNEVLKAVTAASKDGRAPHWHSGEWLYVECYMYRKICDILETNGVSKKYDFFHAQKAESFESSIKAAYDLSVWTLGDVFSGTKLSPTRVQEAFQNLMLVCLWGNKNDLSLSGGRQVSQDESPLSQLPILAQFLLVDDHQRVLSYLSDLRKQQRDIRVDFVCDNASFELFSDLCLADFLCAYLLANRVTFHVKALPWFVSDTTRPDVAWLLKRMQRDRQGPALPALAARWKQRFDAGQWSLASDPFWTSPFPFRRMRQEAASLYRQLENADLVIVKGDLNYRKLVGDRRWPLQTPLCRAMEGFHPAPVAALRVLKADLAAGLPRAAVRRAQQMDPDWMTGGRFAVIQFCTQVPPLD
ncbi:damage-control phosphatase ARMT1-like [Amphibalanus amphitrite]|uniref:damage-control phosphatase ARMT1-like n=1 Tax=Amphibalanus amphitrite TaxID=1232801 RepID=UPI001C90F146|nr:damage-control phosphatase ARMT1-like [Amphibalanus amphitrite]